MGKRDYYARDHNVICDRCGAKFKNSECEKDGYGWYVCKQYCWEARHPQDYVRGLKDDMRVSIARLRTAPVFIIPEDF